MELLFELESVSAPRVSPGGQQLVFTRTWNDALHDRPASELWLIERDGSRLRQLGEGSGAEWSPDGSRLAFLRDGKPDGTQVHVLWLATREVTQVTRGALAPTALRWSPDGATIAFQAVVEESGSPLPITLPKRPDGAKWAEEATIISRLQYRRDQSEWRPAGFEHLFVVDASGGTPRQVTAGDFDHGPGEWTPDGRRLVTAELDRDCFDLEWQPDGAALYFTAESRGERQLYRCALGGRPQQLTSEPQRITQLDRSTARRAESCSAW